MMLIGGLVHSNNFFSVEYIILHDQILLARCQIQQEVVLETLIRMSLGIVTVTKSHSVI